MGHVVSPFIFGTMKAWRSSAKKAGGGKPVSRVTTGSLAWPTLYQWRGDRFAQQYQALHFSLSSDSRLVTRMADPALLVEVINRGMDGGIEHGRIPERLVGEMVAFQIPPA